MEWSLCVLVLKMNKEDYFRIKKKTVGKTLFILLLIVFILSDIAAVFMSFNYLRETNVGLLIFMGSMFSTMFLFVFAGFVGKGMIKIEW